MRTRLAVSVIRAAIFNSLIRNVVNSARAKGCGSGVQYEADLIGKR